MQLQVLDLTNCGNGHKLTMGNKASQFLSSTVVIKTKLNAAPVDNFDAVAEPKEVSIKKQKDPTRAPLSLLEPSPLIVEKTSAEQMAFLKLMQLN